MRKTKCNAVDSTFRNRILSLDLKNNLPMKIHYFTLLFLLIATTGISQTNTIRLHIEDPLSQEVRIGYHLGEKQYLLGQEGTPASAPTDETGNQLAILDSEGNRCALHSETDA